MENVILGTDLMLFKKNGETFEALGGATSCKLAVSANVLETSSKDNGKWTSKKASKLSWNASTDNLFILANYTSLMEAMTSRTPVTLSFAKVSNADSDNGKPEGGWQPDTTTGYTGEAIITNIEANAPDGENATYSVTFEGSGALLPMGGK